MATLINNVNELKPAVVSYSVPRIMVTGLTVGAIYWCFFAISLNYFSSTTISSNIATVLAIVSGIAIMIRLRMAQPLVISSAAGLALWGLGGLAIGLGTVEKIFWFCLIYCLAYTLFSWIMQFKRVGFAIIFSAIIIIVLRIILSY